ncbi:MAG: beta-propeller domain-containing protein [Anaeroplasmataceae bacterium]|nr:beta-propeller domain-containing protein [Anaeroplasmataceae bacterium]
MKLKKYEKRLKKEYKETFVSKKIKSKRYIQFKLRYVVATVLGILLVGLFIQHLCVLGHNAAVKKHNLAIRQKVYDVENSSALTKVKDEKEINTIILNYKNESTYQEKETSILSKIFSLRIGGCAGKAYAPQPAPGDSGSKDAFHTNVQIEGIEEADVAKSDGRYIYYLNLSTLFVYDMTEEKNIASIQDDGYELFIYEDIIITIGTASTCIYEFTQNELNQQKKISYNYYLTSRMMKDSLYLAFGDYVKENQILYNNCYYDACSNPNYIYTLYHLDLKTLDTKVVQLLASKDTKLYASNNAFYFASLEKQYTSISIFSLSLEPMGVIRVRGYVLNQFSMDEYDNYFRVITTDTSRNAEELNTISIFDLTTLTRVGYLDQGIGKERQVVKSVRFDKEICYVVTYETKDPLYEINCSNPEEPIIISAYEAPGYSSYLHPFKMGDKEYVFGLGYTDNGSMKISVYERTEGTTQVGNDFILSQNEYYTKADYYNPNLNESIFNNHKALFIYEEDSYLYLGMAVAFDAYLIFKIDVTSEEVITIYQDITLILVSWEESLSRAFLKNGKLYITNYNQVIVRSFTNE